MDSQRTMDSPGSVPISHPELEDETSLLIREAAALRRGQRVYRRVLTLFILLAIGSVTWRGASVFAAQARSRRDLLGPNARRSSPDYSYNPVHLIPTDTPDVKAGAPDGSA